MILPLIISGFLFPGFSYKPSPGTNLPPDSELKFEITKSGAPGCVRAVAGKRVSVHYTGWTLQDAKQFDSSVSRKQPFDFDLGAGQVIQGWDQGVEGMCKGEIRILTIPSDLGYGSQGAGGVIPPHATLVFEVELLNADVQASRKVGALMKDL